MWFNAQCVRLKRFPKFISIKCNNKSTQACNAFQIVKQCWLKSEIKKQYSARDNLNMHCYLIQVELLHIKNPIEFNFLDQQFRLEANLDGIQLYKKQKKKLMYLTASMPDKFTQPTVNSMVFYSRVRNFSNTNFSEAKIAILNKVLD